MKNRRMLTFVRMIRHGVNNFSRNAWLTMAATAVMSVTLLIVFMTVAARQVLLDAAAAISKQADISIYLKGDTPDDKIKEITERIQNLDNIDSVRYISAAQARQEQAERFKDNQEALEAIKESKNEMSATLRVSVTDLRNYQSLEEFVKNDDFYAKYKDPRREASFRGERRQAIDTIGNWVRIASIGGSIATGVFVIISSLVVFNTIRMAIFNRKDEIQMMKLIGANRGFIRGPFVVEAVMYGLIAAVIAVSAGYGLIVMAKDPMTKYGIPVDGLLSTVMLYIWAIVPAMMLLGAMIGTVSAWVATRKYLKL